MSSNARLSPNCSRRWRSADLEERRGGRYVLDMFSKREDLYADVDRSVAQLTAEYGQLRSRNPPAPSPRRLRRG